MGFIPTTERPDIVWVPPRVVGRTRRNMWGRGKYPTRSWAEPSLSRDAAIERAQHGAGDRGGAVAAAEFARLEPRGKRRGRRRSRWRGRLARPRHGHDGQRARASARRKESWRSDWRAPCP